MAMYSQLSRNFALPFPWGLLLLPLRIGEWLLYWCLSTDKSA
jgi:hypothetical protein